MAGLEELGDRGYSRLSAPGSSGRCSRWRWPATRSWSFSTSRRRSSTSRRAGVCGTRSGGSRRQAAPPCSPRTTWRRTGSPTGSRSSTGGRVVAEGTLAEIKSPAADRRIRCITSVDAGAVAARPGASTSCTKRLSHPRQSASHGRRRGFLMIILDLPGCVADGATVDEALVESARCLREVGHGRRQRQGWAAATEGTQRTVRSADSQDVAHAARQTGGGRGPQLVSARGHVPIRGTLPIAEEPTRRTATGTGGEERAILQGSGSGRRRAYGHDASGAIGPNARCAHGKDAP